MTTHTISIESAGWRWSALVGGAPSPLPTIPPIDLREPLRLTGPADISWWVPELPLVPIVGMRELEDILGDVEPDTLDEGLSTGAFAHAHPNRWTLNGTPLRVCRSRDRFWLLPTAEEEVLAHVGIVVPVSMTSGYDAVEVVRVTPQITVLRELPDEDDRYAEPVAVDETDALDLALATWWPAEIGFIPAEAEVGIDAPQADRDAVIAHLLAMCEDVASTTLTLDGHDVDLVAEAARIGGAAR